MIWGWEERRRAERWAAEVLARAQARSVRRDDEAPSGHRRPPRRSRARPAPAAPLPDFGGLSDPFVVRLMQLLRDQEGAARRFDHLEAELAAQGTDPNEVLRREHHAPGRQPGHRRQLRAQPPAALGHRLERLLRAEQPRRGDPPRGPLRRLPAAGLRHQRPIPPRSSRRSPGARAPTRSRSPPRHRAGPPGPGATPGDGRRPHRRAARPRRLLPGRPRPPELEAAFGYRPGWRERLFDWVLGHPGTTYFGAIAVLLAALLALAVGARPGLRRPARGG